MEMEGTTPIKNSSIRTILRSLARAQLAVGILGLLTWSLLSSSLTIAAGAVGMKLTEKTNKKSTKTIRTLLIFTLIFNSLEFISLIITAIVGVWMGSILTNCIGNQTPPITLNCYNTLSAAFWEYDQNFLPNYESIYTSLGTWETILSLNMYNPSTQMMTGGGQSEPPAIFYYLLIVSIVSPVWSLLLLVVNAVSFTSWSSSLSSSSTTSYNPGFVGNDGEIPLIETEERSNVPNSRSTHYYVSRNSTSNNGNYYSSLQEDPQAGTGTEYNNPPPQSMNPKDDDYNRLIHNEPVYPRSMVPTAPSI